MAFAGVLIPLKWLMGWLVAAPAAGVVAAAVIGVEVVVAIQLMGRWFERLDLSMDRAG